MTGQSAGTRVQGRHDGIICIGGEDWWYHNRGHFDFQIMREIARRQPVLFVNSLGVRMPTIVSDHGGAEVFARRIARKLKSLSRGLVHVENGFHVFSPVSAPGGRLQSLTGWALAPQIRWAASRAGIHRPILWVHCPAGARLVDEIPAEAVVLQRTDRFEAFPEGDPDILTAQIEALKARADLVVYAAPHLMAEETGQVAQQLLVTHGVEIERFVAAGRAAGSGRAEMPADMAGIPHPRVGFIGGIDRHTFDPELFLEVAARHPDASFVMVGGTTMPAGWCQLPNVTFLGRKPYDEVADYMAAMDVLIMPWNASEWIKACNPIKLKEYLAAGRPVVTRDFAALEPWRDLVSVASDAEGFATAIAAALDGTRRHDPEVARARLAGESWADKARLVEAALGRLTAQPTGAREAA